MSEYRPDNWVVIKMTRQPKSPFLESNRDLVTYKVLACWNGGYLDGESWRMNSGVDFVVDHKDEVHFHGRSGSNYICGKGQYGMRRNGSSIFERMTKESESMDIDVTLLDKDTDWIKLLR